MSSPVVSPPPRRRSMGGPVILIIMGLIFLLGNLHLISWKRLGLWFAHYWPLLLILWGVLKLVEHYRAKREGAAAPGLGAGGVVLLIFLIIGGLAASQMARVDLSGMSDDFDIGDSHIPFLGESFDFDDQVTQDFPAGAAVKIVNDRGAVNVNVSSGNKIEINTAKKIRSDNKDEAEKWNAQTKPQVTVSGNLVTINANTKGAGDHPVTVDLNVSLPRKAALTIAAQRGDVNVNGRDGNVEIADQRGDVSVEDINGDVTLNMDRSAVNMGHSSVRVSQVSGDVTVQGKSNDVSIADVKGAVKINGDVSDGLKLSKIGKTVNFKSSRTDLEFSKLDGDLDLDSDSLRGDNLFGPVRLSTRSKDVSLDSVSGDVRIQDENSGVQVGLKAPGNVQIDNRNGDITLGVPDKVGFKVEARSRGGEVQADFAGVNVTNTDEDGKASGTFGNGAMHVVLNSEHGNITVHKREMENASVPAVPVPPKPPHKAPPAPSEGPTEN
jgi:cell wall-active antibiotic response 4TMS protein YvqF